MPRCRRQPYFASTDPNEAYLAAQAKINLNTPAQSRFVVRLAHRVPQLLGDHARRLGGLPGQRGGDAGCDHRLRQRHSGHAGRSEPGALQGADTDQGTVASGGNRYEANLVAKYEFKTGTGSTAYDTSGVDPAADLSSRAM